MPPDRDVALHQLARSLGLDPREELRIGGIYTPVVVHRGTAWVSGQVPRVGTQLAVAGRVPDQATLEDARRGARIAAVRALLLLQRACGNLARVEQALRLGVFVHCAPDFGLHSEVGDAASEVLHAVLGEHAGRHARTSVGVAQLPKGASVEVDLVVAVQEGADHGQ